jgi:hypothetical protein
MRKIALAVALAGAALAQASSEASAMSFTCEAVGWHSRGWGHNYYISIAKTAALNRCVRHGETCTISYCRPW